jgi:hypothetical protein
MIKEFIESLVRLLRVLKLKLQSKWKSPCCECFTKGSVNDSSDSDSDSEQKPK